MKKFIKEFKEFIATGNMLELAVAVILGVAVKAAIDAFTKDFVMQIVASVGNTASFDALHFTIRKTPIVYGTTITQLINLVVVGLVLFLMIKAYNRMKHRLNPPKPAEPAAPAGPTEIELLTEIRDALKSRS
jgi:large conductance mechanosensitive channel